MSTEHALAPSRTASRRPSQIRMKLTSWRSWQNAPDQCPILLDDFTRLICFCDVGRLLVWGMKVSTISLNFTESMLATSSDPPCFDICYLIILREKINGVECWKTKYFRRRLFWCECCYGSLWGTSKNMKIWISYLSLIYLLINFSGMTPTCNLGEEDYIRVRQQHLSWLNSTSYITLSLARHATPLTRELRAPSLFRRNSLSLLFGKPSWEVRTYTTT